MQLYCFQIFFSVILLASTCTQTTNYFGTWRCDTTGSVKSVNNNGDWQEGEILSYYTAIGVSYMELTIGQNDYFSLSSIMSDGSTNVTTGVYSYSTETSTLLIQGNGPNVEDSSLKIMSIKQDKMTAILDVEGDGKTLFTLHLDRV